MKRYIKPELEITEVKAQTMLISISQTPADKDYEGGGDAKAINFADEDGWN